MNAPTVYQQLSYKIKIASMPYSGINAIHLSKLSPRKDCGGTPCLLHRYRNRDGIGSFKHIGDGICHFVLAFAGGYNIAYNLNF